MQNLVALQKSAIALALGLKQLAIVGPLLYEDLAQLIDSLTDEANALSPEDYAQLRAQAEASFAALKDFLIETEDALEDFKENAEAFAAGFDDEATDPSAGLLVELPQLEEDWALWRDFSHAVQDLIPLLPVHFAEAWAEEKQAELLAQWGRLNQVAAA